MGIFDRDPVHPEPHAELKKLNESIHNQITALREASETKNKETVARLEREFEKYDEENSKFAREVALFQKQVREIQDVLATGGTLNTKGQLDYSRVGAFGRELREYKTFASWLTNGRALELKSGDWSSSDIDFKTLRTDSESAGGYLIPQVMDAQVRKNIIEVSPVRQHARVRMFASKTMDIPRRLAVPIAQFEGEAEAGPTDQSVYGSEQITCYRQTVSIPATLDMMVSSAFDLEQEIASDVADSFAQGEGINFVKGNGRKSPQGFLTDPRVVPYTSDNAGNFTFDDLAKFSGKLKRGQQPWWYMNRKTVAYVQALKSSIGVPIWMPVAGNQPATIWGFPYEANMIDMDDVATGSGSKLVAFADLYRGYEIFDMAGINVVRDDITQATAAITKWTFRRYLTGRVIVPEAIGVMTLA